MFYFSFYCIICSAAYWCNKWWWR